MPEKTLTPEEAFHAALAEAADWERQLTHDERTKITLFEAKRNVLARITAKYQPLIIPKA